MAGADRIKRIDGPPHCGQGDVSAESARLASKWPRQTEH
jgi:hypothetical protein